MLLRGWNKGFEEAYVLDGAGLSNAEIGNLIRLASGAGRAAPASPASADTAYIGIEADQRLTRIEGPTDLRPDASRGVQDMPVSIGRCSCGMHPLDDLDRTGINDANGAGRTELIAQTFDAADDRYEFSGNLDVDAVLIGSRWTLQDFTFSFPTSGAFYAGQGYDAGGEPSQQTPFNAQQQQAVRYAYSLISSYTGLTFTEVTETSTVHADFRFSQTNHPEKVPSAYANFPSSSAKAGDVWFGKTNQPFYETPAVGNWGMATMLHEMGHTMGLKHGHQDYTTVDLAGEGYLDAPAGGGPRRGSRALPSHHDGQDWALMSYRPDPTAPGENPPFAGDGFNQPQTYMQSDIAALQYLYGANFNHNAGNTTYMWSPSTGTMIVNGVPQVTPTGNKISMTLWDGNGNDTYDLSNYSTDLTVNLQPGAFSTFSYAQLVNHQAENGDGDELTSGGAIAVGNLANALLYRNDGRSLIENAVGGSGDDSMVGNRASNTLRAGAGGADFLVGDAGNDFLYGDAGADTLYGDGAPASASGVGMGSGTVFKPYGGGNHSMATAYNLTNYFSLSSNADIEQSTTIPHVTVNANGDYNFDYYAVTVTAGTTLTFDIDNTFALDTIIFLRDASGKVLASNDDSSITQGGGGSTFPYESYLTYTVTRSGTYYLQVAEFVSAGQYQGPQEFTQYQLHISASGRAALGEGAGNDHLDGGTGADTMIGGLGNDTYAVDVAGDRIVEAAGGGNDTVRSSIVYALAATLENLVLTGGAAINGTGNGLANRINGNAAANTLNGGGGNDRLDGGAGADTMKGGAGNDSYFVDNAADKAIELASEGTDTVSSSVSYTLGAELERLVLTGTAAISGTGNAVANSITGNARANALSGGGGSDVIDGAGGADTMRGGIGNDTYVVDNSRDVVIETAGEGTDTVQSSATFTLGAEVERLILTGTGAIRGNGNALANSIAGNEAANFLDGRAGADRMTGGAGDDTYVIDNISDRAVEAAAGGRDTIRSSVSLTLAANVENLIMLGTAHRGTGNILHNTIFGNGAANLLDGREGNDTLDGKGGADRMSGGAGNDLYFVDNAADRVVEALNAGMDAIRSSISFTLAANVEALVLTGGAAASGVGNILGNAITGNSGANKINGREGSDTLTGGGGADLFLFNSALNGAKNVDDILDFNISDDTIFLDRTIFSAVAANGRLAATAFVTGTAAADAGDRIIHDRATGNIYYDPDGSGAAAKILFAHVDPGMALTNADFYAVA